MSKSFHLLGVSSRIVAVLMAGAALAHAQSSPVVFQGLPHTAVGYATLQLDPARGALDVIGLGSAGKDGVAVKRSGSDELDRACRGARRRNAAVEPVLERACRRPADRQWSASAEGRHASR